MLFLVGTSTGRYLQHPPTSWWSRTERWRMGAPMASSRCEPAPSFRCSWTQPPTGLIPRGCRVKHRQMGSPMVGFRHGPGISFSRTWLTLDPTSLGEDVTLRPRTWPNWPRTFYSTSSRTRPALKPDIPRELGPHSTLTWPGHFTRLWPELDPHLTREFYANLTRARPEFGSEILTRTWPALDPNSTRTSNMSNRPKDDLTWPNAPTNTGLNQSRDTASSNSFNNWPTDKPETPAP